MLIVAKFGNYEDKEIVLCSKNHYTEKLEEKQSKEKCSVCTRKCDTIPV